MCGRPFISYAAVCGTGTGFMKASLRNRVQLKLIYGINGSFGKRFADVATFNGRAVTI
jgi:aspartate aminotransferase-like enzyme